jgi:hypothetical protein
VASEIEDPEQKEFELKMSKVIQEMPSEVKDRFKALKVLMVSIIGFLLYNIFLKSQNLINLRNFNQRRFYSIRIPSYAHIHFNIG